MLKKQAAIFLLSLIIGLLYLNNITRDLLEVHNNLNRCMEKIKLDLNHFEEKLNNLTDDYSQFCNHLNEIIEKIGNKQTKT